MALSSYGCDSRRIHQKNSGGEKQITREPHKLETWGATPLAASKIRRLTDEVSSWFDSIRPLGDGAGWPATPCLQIASINIQGLQDELTSPDY